jgi:uncharacterized protein (TIGR03067 family)
VAAMPLANRELTFQGDARKFTSDTAPFRKPRRVLRRPTCNFSGASRNASAWPNSGVTKMHSTFRIAALAIFAVSGVAFAEDKAVNLDGTYTIESGERDGKAIPAEELKGAIVKFEGDKIVGTDKDKKQFFGCTFTIDRASKPMAIRMVSTKPVEGEKTAGVIEMTGDTIKICYALPGGAAPKDFKTAEKQQCFTLKKITQ